MQSLNTKKEYRSEVGNSNIVLEDIGRVDEVKALDSLLTCQDGHHTSIVWDKNNKGATLVRCGHCHTTIYDGNELSMDALGLVEEIV
ncbi:MAG: hypothetical protein ACE5KA_04000 [Nitrososphaerales archaeon]